MYAINIRAVSAAALLALYTGEVASAATVTIDFVNANVSVAGQTDGSGNRPVAVASKTDTKTVEGTVDTIRGTAVQNENGFSSLELTVKCDGYTGTACTGDLAEIENRATAIRRVTFTNETSTPQAGTFSFSLSGMKLETWHYGGGPIDPEASVEFSVGATNGATYTAEMTLLSTFPQGGPKHEIITSTNFSGSVVNGECDFGFCYAGSVDIDPLSSMISLGTLQPGASVSVDTTFDIYTIFNRTEIGAQARAVDPGTYNWQFTPVGATPTAPIPLPAGLPLLLSGIATLAGFRALKSRPVA